MTRSFGLGSTMALVLLALAPSEPNTIVRLTTDGLVKQRPSWSRDGKRLTFALHESGGTHIYQYVMNPSSAEPARRLTKREMPEYDGVFAPDGTSVVLVVIKLSGTDGNLDVASVPLEGGEPHLLAGDIDNKRSHQDWPSWSPDGQRLAFSSTHDGNQEIYTAKADGTDLIRVTQSPGLDTHPCWTSDGQSLIFTTDRWSGLELAKVRADGSSVTRLTTSRGLDDYAAVSPDGTRIAFVSNRDGNFEVYVSGIDGSNPKNLSRHPRRDTMPTWTPDGKGITFVSERDGGSDLYTIRVESH